MTKPSTSARPPTPAEYARRLAAEHDKQHPLTEDQIASAARILAAVPAKETDQAG